MRREKMDTNKNEKILIFRKRIKFRFYFILNDFKRFNDYKTQQTNLVFNKKT